MTKQKIQTSKVLQCCSYCGKPRFKNNEALWGTGIRIFHIESQIEAYEITICPKCRGLPLYEVLGQAVLNLSEWKKR